MMLNNKLDKLVLHSSSLTRSAICPRCGKYNPTLKALEAHRSVCENIVFATNNEEPKIDYVICERPLISIVFGTIRIHGMAQ